MIEDGDIFELLGGDRILPGDASTLSSVFVDTATVAVGTQPANQKVRITCKYNAQPSTQRHLYLRTDINNTNIQTTSFDAENSDRRDLANLSSSRILAKLETGDDFITYTTSTQMEYFVNLTTRF